MSKKEDIQIDSENLSDIQEIQAKYSEEFPTLSDFVNSSIRLITRCYLREKGKVDTILEKDNPEPNSYFNKRSLVVIDKIIEMGLDFWTDPAVATTNLYNQYDKIPANIKKGWKQVASQFCDAGENYILKRNLEKFSSSFIQAFIDKKIFYEKEEFTKFSSFVKKYSNDSIKPNLREDYFIPPNINRILPAKFILCFIYDYLKYDAEARDTEVRKHSIGIVKLKEILFIVVKSFVISLVMKDTLEPQSENIDTVKKSRRENRNATGFPYAAEFYQKSITDIEKLIDSLDKSIFDRFFNAFICNYDLEAKKKLKSHGLLHSVGLIDFYYADNKEIVSPLEENSQLRVSLSSDGIEFLKLIEKDQRNSYFSLVESEFMLKKLSENPLQKDIFRAIIISIKDFKIETELDKFFRKDPEKTEKSQQLTNDFLNYYVENKAPIRDEDKKIHYEAVLEIERRRNEKIEESIRGDDKKDDEARLLRISNMGILSDLGIIQWNTKQRFNHYKINNEYESIISKIFGID